jgi:hypothetical protein
MAQITCAFQGPLIVPLFKTPYTVTVPGYYSQGTSRYAAINPFGDTPLIGEIYNHQTQAEAFTPFSLTGGEMVALRYGNTNKFTINGGWNSAGDTFLSSTTSYYAGKLNYGFTWATQNPANNKYTSWAAVNVSAFFKDRNVGTLQPPPNESGDVSNWNIDNATPYLPSYGGAFSNLPCVIGFSAAIGFAGSMFLTGNGAPWIVAVPPGFMWPAMEVAGHNYSSQLVGQTITDFEICANLIQPGSLTNYLFGFGTTATVRRISWSIPTYVTFQLNVLAQDTIVFDNNSNLNAQLTKYNSQTVMSPLGVRGMLATDIDAGIDYFVNVDGTKYWQIVYQPQGDVPAIPKPSQTEASHKFVDTNGTFWYTGSASQNGSVIQPFYSLGANIPYGIFSLNFPPFALPCFEDGCGNALGIDWPGTGIYKVK